VEDRWDTARSAAAAAAASGAAGEMNQATGRVSSTGWSRQLGTVWPTGFILASIVLHGRIELAAISFSNRNTIARPITGVSEV
jgi:hypothetical protein